MRAYADAIAVIVSMYSDIELVDETLKDCEMVARAKINLEKLVGTRIGTWRSRHMPYPRQTG